MRMNIPTASNAIQTKSAPLSLRPASSARPAVAAIAAVARSAFPVLATLAALATVTTLTTLPVGAQTRTQTVYVSPNPVESGRAFQVTVSGRTSLCDPQFSHHDAKVEKGLVNFTVMAVNNPLAKCSGEVRDFKTDFTVPALKKGTYPVEARLYPACAYDKTPCPMLLDPVEYGGDLLVQDSADLFLAMRPDKVSADKAFDLFVTSKYYTCGNEYSNLSTQVEGHILYVNYTNRPNQEAICPAILKDYGPTFKVPAMKAGVYQVFATVNPYCAPNTPCPLIMMAPQLAGALTVGEGATALNGEGGPGKGGSEIGNAARGQGFKNGSLRVDALGGVTVRWNNGTSTVTGKRQ